MIDDIKTIVRYQIRNTGTLRLQIEHQITGIENLLNQLHVKNSTKHKRSINWIRSAWKWIAGNPDATDWDNILSQTNNVIKNNNRQYTINEYLIKTTNNLLDDYNKIIAEVNTNDTTKYAQTLFNRLGLVKEEVAQIVMASQLAKSGIVHSPILNKGDISNILSQTETLPYKNEMQALQFAEPSMVIKDSLLLYIISLPQTEDTLYNNILIRSTVSNNKRIYLKFTNLLVSNTKKYGIKDKCIVIDDITVYKLSQVESLGSDNCIVNLLNGENATCEYQMENKPIVEVLSESTIFLTNYKGNITYSNSTQSLNGTFIINFFNETITLDDVNYSNWQITSTQVLPPILQGNLTEKEIKLDLQYLHHLHLKNIRLLDSLSYKGIISISSNFALLFIGFSIILVIQLHSRCKNRQKILRFPTLTELPEIKINYP